MKYKKINNAVSIVHNLMKEHLKSGDVVLDCTMGNGKDTLLMAELVGPLGKVYGFDIQDIAIENTKDLLKELDYNNTILIKESHEFIDRYIDEALDFIVYNLGYLPGGDKNIKTKVSTTISSIKKALKMLKPNGILCIVSYIGHDGGMEENIGISELLSELDQKTFNVLKFRFINQKNNPPILYVVEKSRNRI
ncbi:class I SAM-dependent methyltransferase [Tissierellaceae bacterium HCP3S3_D8]